MKRKLLHLFAVAIVSTFSFYASGQISGYYQEDFEGTFPPNDWQTVDVADPANVWQQSPLEHYSGTKSAHINYSGVDVLGDDWLILPQFSATASDSISFWMAADYIGYIPDTTFIMVSTTDANLTSFTAAAMLIEGVDYPSTADQFTYYSWSLDAYAGQDIYVAIRNVNVFGDGLYFDLVTIGTLPAANASTESIDIPDNVSTVSALTPQATVKNSSLSEQSFPVTMTISGGYSSTKDVTNLGAGESIQVDFDSWTPTAGSYTVNVGTDLTDDGAPADDTLSKTVTALDPLSVFYQQDFEGDFPPTGWQIKDVLEQGNTWQQSSAFPYTGVLSSYLMWSSSLSPGEDWLILPQFTVASTDSVDFWLAVAYIDFPPDSTEILVSTTDANISSFTTSLGVLSEGDNYPTETFSYVYYSFPLAAFAGQNVYVALKNRNTNGDGLYVDRVRIGTPPSINATAVSIDVPAYISTNEYSPMATVKNSSIATQSFPVTLTISGGYTSTMQVDNLGAGATQQVTFDPWTPSAGAATLTLETQLAGDLDAADDTISLTINAYEPFINYGWTSRATTPDPIWDAGLATASPGSSSPVLYTLAGVTDFTLVPETKMYDPGSDAWTTLTSMMIENYNSCAAAVNDKIYVAGGYNPPFAAIGSNQIYDIASDSWSSGTEMPIPVGDYAMGVYHDSLLYFFGGYDLNTFSDYAAVQIYDPLNDNWTSGTDIPTDGFGWQSGISGNKIVLFGGTDVVSGAVKATTYVGTINTSNPADITWEQVEDNPSGPAFRPGGAASTDPTSGLVIFTAGDPDGSATSALQNTFAYDVTSGSWKIGPDKPTAVNNLRNLTCVEYKDSLYLVSVGGLDANSIEMSVNEWLNLGPAGFGVGVNAVEPMDVSLSSYPNPFTKSTLLTFTLPTAANVTVTIVDVAGREVQELFNKNLPAGVQQVKWNALGIAAGVYFAKITVGDQVTTEKLVKLN